MADESVLRARAREAIKTGNLPAQRPERLWGGAGSGAPCAVCGEVVDKEDVELELQFTSGGVCAGTNYHLHAKCFTAWELERRSRGANVHPLPPSDDDGIMPSRELNTPGRGEGERG